MANPTVFPPPMVTFFRSPIRSSLLSRRLARAIQKGVLHYEYKGVPCMKSPFDMALYLRLLGQVRPRTIVEIGTLSGGSALWMADQARSLGLDVHIYSCDLYVVSKVQDPVITFLPADVTKLDESDLPRILENCARPLLVIEDGPHTYEGCTRALEFFAPRMRDGEYIVIEDGIVKVLGLRKYGNGPNRAVRRFLRAHGDRFSIDTRYTDYYGQNVTWSMNGFIRCTKNPR